MKAKRKKVCSAARVSGLRFAGALLAIEAWREKATPRPVIPGDEVMACEEELQKSRKD